MRSTSQNLFLAMHGGQGRAVNIYCYMVSVHNPELFSNNISINENQRNMDRKIHGL